MSMVTKDWKTQCIVQFGLNNSIRWRQKMGEWRCVA